VLRPIVLQGTLLLVSIVGCTSTLSPSSPRMSWMNEPAGLRVLSEWGFDQPPAVSGDAPIPGSAGWHIVADSSPHAERGDVLRASDVTAPLSPPDVYDVVFPRGMIEGTSPATIYYEGFSTREIYAAFWWKASSPFDLGPNGHKIAFLFNGGGGSGGQQFLILGPDARLHVLPEYPGDFRWRDPNVNATPVTLASWHLVEWHADAATGLLEWWLDGMIQGRHHDVRNGQPFDLFELSPTWGGNTGAAKHETDHYWFDHVRLSIR
jgi:hypothetical protein